MNELWLKADEGNWEERKPLITTALESGFDSVLVKEGEEEKLRELGNIQAVSSGESADIKMKRVEKKDDLTELDDFDAALVSISDREDEDLAAEASDWVNFLVTVEENWEIIPLEDLIAELQSEDVNLIPAVDSPEDVRTALETLEAGSDGVLFEGKDVEATKQAAKVYKKTEKESIKLSAGEITKVEKLGMGYRACVDTSSLMGKGEGMLVGNSSSGMFLVHSESIDTPYVDPRPFRVNAGGVHAYIRLPEGKTEYLSELEAGDSVAVVDQDGNSYEAIVGRVKIEKRPMMLIQAEMDAKKISLLLQNAETIRLVTPEGEPVSIAELEPGDEVLVHAEEGGGRHFGKEVDESIIEK